jgi:hypothetical protein
MVAGRRTLLWVTVIWSLIVGSAIIIETSILLAEARTSSFAKTSGTLDSINMTDDTDPNLGFVYHYQAYGRQLEGRRVVPVKIYASDAWVNKMFSRFPIGSHPAVYYNPSIPAQSVLIAGIQPEDLRLALLISPFALVMLVLWLRLIFSFRNRD